MLEKYKIYHEITPEDAKKWMDAMKPEDYVLLDVRSKTEYDAEHIEGAILLPEQDLEAKLEQVLTDRTKPVFVYCRSGIRSKIAAKHMANAGYRKVYEFGGILDWNYETVHSAPS